MSTAQAVAVMVLQAVVGAVYLYVGRRIAQRRVEGDARLAAQMFQFWWYGLAAISWLGPVLRLVGLYARLPVSVYVAIIDGFLGLICLAFLGLMYYLLYLYTGSRRILVPLVAYWTIVFLGIVALIDHADFNRFEGEGLDRELVPERDLEDSPWATWLVIALIVPPLLSAGAYFLLFFQVEDRTARFRVALVSASFILWFGSSLAASALGADNEGPWQFVSLAISLTASLAVLVAYTPPTWLRERLRVGSIEGA